ncbi:YbdD/YjiX family protein [Streptomyces sporangiiformans]|uniref:YbdD/YjiX family protein n=1 Tax=Streptomyces sporangiiformans TaxID=2315329 RepID=UPI001F093B8A|nr:YbdD/YjiX family protein [Streptomyces sporangiiformans]
MNARHGSLLSTARQWARTVRWYLRELTGEAEYDRYCDRHRRHHPHAPVPSRREYEVLRTHHRENHPQSRCC